jgi:hypothetical protein
MLIELQQQQRWGLARVQGGRELAFKDWADDNAIHIYLPTGQRRIRSRGSRHKTFCLVPMFPGYAFVLRPQHWMDYLRNNSLFMHFLRDPEGFIIQVCQAVIDDLRNREDSGEFNDLEPLIGSGRLLVGMRLRIKAGPMAGFCGRCLAVFRNSLLLDVKGRAIRMRPEELEEE